MRVQWETNKILGLVTLTTRSPETSGTHIPKGNMTYQNIRQKLMAEMEPAEPAETLMRVLVENEGKRLDKRIEKKLQDAIGDPYLRISKECGMTSILTTEYRNTHGNKGVRLYVSHSLSCDPIDSADIRKRNTCYFSAREERNKAREELLKTTIPGSIQSAVERYEAAKAELDEYEDQYFNILPRLYDR